MSTALITAPGRVYELLSQAILANGGNLTDLSLLGSPAVAEDVAKTITRYAAMFGKTYPITVDYSVSLVDMIAAGQYDYVNPDVVAANFPIVGTGIVTSEMIPVHLDRDIGSDEAVAELTRLGIDPLGIEHACAFGAQFPEVQREFPIVFLKSVWESPDRSRYLPYLFHWYGGRRLSLSDWRLGWLRDSRFAGVRKVLPTPAL